jgi:hypothetical protein
MARIDFTSVIDGLARSLASPLPAPANRFQGMLPIPEVVGPRRETLGAGAPVVYRFRTDHTLALRIPNLRGPSARNLVVSPRMDTDTDGNGIVNNFASAADVGFTSTFSLDAAESAQKLVVTASPAGGNKVIGVLQGFTPVTVGDVRAGSFEVKFSGLTNGMTGEVLLVALTSGGVYIAGYPIVTGLTNTAWTRVLIPALTIPATAVSLQLYARLNAPSAAATGTMWVRRANLERKAAPTAWFLDSPTDLAIAYALKEHLEAGGTVTLAGENVAGTTYTAFIAPGSKVAIEGPDEENEYAFRATLANSSAAAMLFAYP